MRGPESFAAAGIKQGVNRILAVTRKLSTGEINLFMLIRPKDERMIHKQNPLNSYVQLIAISKPIVGLASLKQVTS